MNEDVDFLVKVKEWRGKMAAKSIMGIFSLNLEETLLLVVNTEDKELVDEKFSKYIIG